MLKVRILSGMPFIPLYFNGRILSLQERCIGSIPIRGTIWRGRWQVGICLVYVLAYNLFYEALKKTKKVALVKTVIGPKFYYGILKLVENGII